MIEKNEPPINVTLEESSSGTWKVPEAPKRQFKPWQRLWFVTGIIYLVMLAGSYYVLIPDNESIERQMVFAVTEETRRYDGMAFAGESPRAIFERARSQRYAKWITSIRKKYRIGPEGNAGFKTIDKNYREAVSDLPMKRTYGVLLCLAAWLVPMSLLYTYGFTVDWIKRGARVM